MGKILKNLLNKFREAVGAGDTAELLAKLAIGQKPTRPPKNTVFLGYLVRRGNRRPGRGRKMTLTTDIDKAHRPRTRRGPDTGEPIAVFRQYWPDAGRKSKHHG